MNTPNPTLNRLSVQEVMPLSRTDVLWIDAILGLWQIVFVWPVVWFYIRVWPNEAAVRKENHRWLLRTGKNRSFEQRVEDGDIGLKDRAFLQLAESDRQWKAFWNFLKPRTWWRLARNEPAMQPEDEVDEDGIPWLSLIPLFVFLTNHTF